MKFIQCTLAFILINLSAVQASGWIRVNKLGYLPSSVKVAVFCSKEDPQIKEFRIKDALSGKIILTGKNIKKFGSYGPFKSGYRLNFSDLRTEGSYCIEAGGETSPVFRIAPDVYQGTADFLLRYMREQRCGYNPFLRDSCHSHDGFIIYNPAKSMEHIDAKGGWHDATDYLQYVTTSANAVFQMLFAYRENPDAFCDEYDASGNPGSNSIPDIIDEAKWGLDWLLKMNPSKDQMYNQIADDRDHAGFRFPNRDSVNYGKGLERPVYFCTGEPQGLFKNKNRSTGIASTAGKFASAFALGSEILKKFYPEYAEILKGKARDAYALGKEHPGVCQTAPCTSPYFYEEDNWTDDMELAAAQLRDLFPDKEAEYSNDALSFGRQEKITPWMGRDTARHYQWYPFVNLGHYFLSSSSLPEKKEFLGYIRDGLGAVYRRGAGNMFLQGVPFIWCSNNLVSAIITQAGLYADLTGSREYEEMEAAMRDWLFGCNPWGKSMIIGLPEGPDSPKDPHSSLWVKGGLKIYGGLVDGPVYGGIFGRLKGTLLTKKDPYADFQSSLAVYHDDYGDFSTNEPTMDGTASLTYYLSHMQQKGMPGFRKEPFHGCTLSHGGIVRTDSTKKNISLIFSGHEYAEGYPVVKAVLDKHRIKASFFFTGDFYRNPKFKDMINDLKKDGMYLGGHSDKHILYCSWEKRDSTLVGYDDFLKDISQNYREMARFGITKEDAKYYLPPFEWHNGETAGWIKTLGLQVINLTPGTWVNQDWTVPDEKPYYSSADLYQRLMRVEGSKGLNGAIILSHFGTDQRRKDKFYNMLDKLVTDLEKKGYRFTSLAEVLK